MILLLLLACGFAKIKGYKIMPIFKAYPLYPYFIIELIYIFLQINIFMRNYSIVQYAGIIKSLYMYSLVIPIIFYKLYKQGICCSILIIIGSLLNKFVMSQNGGEMPVYATLSKITGYYNETAIQTVDKVHSIGTASTKFKFLTDYIDTGFSVLSIGDLLIHSIVFIVIYYTLKELNRKVYSNGNIFNNIV